MPVDVLNSIVIGCPVTEVSRYAADPDNVPLWYENIKSVEWKTSRPVQVGSRIKFVAQFLGRRLAYTYEVVEFVPGSRLTMRTPGPPFPMETSYTWQNREWRHTNGASEPGHAERILRVARASDVAHGRKGEPEGSGVAQATS